VDEEEKDRDRDCKNEGGGQNWLVALANAMAAVQSKHLNELMKANKEMQDNVGDSKSSSGKNQDTHPKIIQAVGRNPSYRNP
jgi:hypothetical protein